MHSTKRPSRLAGTLLAGAFLVPALAGCGAGGMHVTLQRQGRSVDVTVHDETGLVTQVSAGASQEPDPLPSAPAAWNPNGDLTQVAVYWQGTPCQDHPVLDMSGNALLITIDPGPVASGCPATGPQPNVVTLRLKEVTDVTAITVRMAHQP